MGGHNSTEEELRAVRELGEALRGSVGGNPELIAQEFQRAGQLRVHVIHQPLQSDEQS